MSEFRRWISYIDAYGSGGKGKNVGFAKIESRNGRCRVQVRIKGIYSCDGRGLKIGFYAREGGRPLQILAGRMRLKDGSGEFTAVTPENDLFDSGYKLSDSGGLWLTGSDPEIFYLSVWEDRIPEPWDFLENTKQEEEKNGERDTAGSHPPSILYVTAAEIAQGLGPETIRSEDAAGTAQKTAAKPVPQTAPQTVPKDVPKSVWAAAPVLEDLPQPDLWESLCRYYPKTAPELRERGVELLQIRPADLRYLPRHLWHFGSNSFLLHGYYHYRHLILGRMTEKKGRKYILGVKGNRSDRERFSAGLFGFDSFLQTARGSREGYWYTTIALDTEK